MGDKRTDTLKDVVATVTVEWSTSALQAPMLSSAILLFPLNRTEPYVRSAACC